VTTTEEVTMSEPMSASEIRRRKVEALKESRDLAQSLDQLEQFKRCLEQLKSGERIEFTGLEGKHTPHIQLRRSGDYLHVHSNGAFGDLIVSASPLAEQISQILLEALAAETGRLQERFDHLTAGVTPWTPEGGK
jgi:hypothetical protein